MLAVPQLPAVFRKNSLARTAGDRRWGALPCKAYKGFGSTASKRKPGNKSGPVKTPQEAADRALADVSKGRRKPRPIDPKEAARGKVDYVQVKDWANGDAPDIGELQVVPGSRGTGYSTGSTAAAGRDQAVIDESVPFWQQLGQHAQYLERQGALPIAQAKANAKPYLPFEAWQYTPARYQQYLAEVAAVHTALESALQLALSGSSGTRPAAAAAAALTGQPDTTGLRNEHAASTESMGATAGAAAHAAPALDSATLPAYSALACFGPSSGLWRAAAAQADLHALRACAAAAAEEQAPAGTVHQHSTLSAPSVSQNSIAYGKYLQQLGKAAAAASAASTAGRTAVEAAEEAEAAAAALKLFAHAYALQAQQQCLGTRIGAAATEKLQLLSAGAVALFMDYPDSIFSGEPVQQLVKVTDAAGQLLDAAGRQAVLDELPKALQKSALMLSPLASAE